MKNATIAAYVLILTTAFFGGNSAYAGNGKGSSNGQGGYNNERVEFKEARLKIEVNATDGDAGIQAFVDVDEWRWISILDTRGKLLLFTRLSGRFARQGGTELFLESAEPDFSELSIEEFKRRFPEGTYRFRGRGINGERFFGTYELTHNIPDGPELLYPLEDDDPVDPTNVVLSWAGVAPANGSPIVGYQVIIEEEDTEIQAIPSVELQVNLPPTVTSFRVPEEFLRYDTEYTWEVVAIEAGGNQTLSEDAFITVE